MRSDVKLIPYMGFSMRSQANQTIYGHDKQWVYRTGCSQIAVGCSSGCLLFICSVKCALYILVISHQHAYMCIPDYCL